MKNKIVLAYSGGLDTTVIVPWLRGNYMDSTKKQAPKTPPVKKGYFLIVHLGFPVRVSRYCDGIALPCA